MDLAADIRIAKPSAHGPIVIEKMRSARAQCHRLAFSIEPFKGIAIALQKKRRE